MTQNAPRNIVICSDGTGNSDVKGRGTNVFKLYEAVDIQSHKLSSGIPRQIAFYDDGVGTSENPVKKILGAAFGWGFSENVRKLYRELVRVYLPGDRIFVFGFSRGAYTVRTLAAFIQFCGILQRDAFVTNEDLQHQIKQCWEEFEKVTFGSRSVLDDSKPPVSDEAQENIRREKDRERRAGYKALIDEQYAPFGDIHIEFIGVWDTVAAVGTPFKELTQLLPFWFKDLTLGPQVHRAYHALSIEDERLTFLPELWEADPRVEQVWFSGVHSNVGGGYPKQGMSLETLDWMMVKAESHGLRFIDAAREYVRTERDVHGKLYDSREGLATYYRWQPRDIFQLCKDRKIDIPQIHVSVFERLAQGTEGYAPGNIPFHCEIVSHSGWPGATILHDAQPLFSNAGALESPGRSSLMDDMRGTIRQGKLTYKLFLATTLLTLLALLIPPFYPTLIVWIVGVNIIVGAAIWALSKAVDKALGNKYGVFWSTRVPGSNLTLRGALRSLGL